MPLDFDVTKYNESAEKRLRPRYLKNIEKNREILDPIYGGKWPGILPLRGRHGDRAAVVVGAGPSAADYTDLLEKLVDVADVDVIAVNRAAKYVPHNQVFLLTTYPAAAEHLDYAPGPGVPLVANSASHPVAIRRWLANGPDNPLLMYHLAGGPRIPELIGLEKHTGPIGRLESAGTVGTQAVEYCIYAGYKYIFCIGYDFIFTGGWTDVSRSVRVEDAGYEPDTLLHLEELKEWTCSTLLVAFQVHIKTIEIKKDILQDRLYNCTPKGLWVQHTDLREVMNVNQLVTV